MRFKRSMTLMLIMTATLTGCMRHPKSSESSETPYKPRPTVSVSTFTLNERIISIYVRHSRGSALFHLAPVETNHGLLDSELKLVMPLRSPGNVEFKKARYETFKSSIDVYEDGRVVLVPLWDADGEAVGVFVNLLSGKRFFFAPSVKSPEAAAQIRALANRWPDITVIVPEERRAHEQVARYPDFEQ